MWNSSVELSVKQACNHENRQATNQKAAFTCNGPSILKPSPRRSLLVWSREHRHYKLRPFPPCWGHGRKLWGSNEAPLCWIEWYAYHFPWTQCCLASLASRTICKALFQSCHIWLECYVYTRLRSGELWQPCETGCGRQVFRWNRPDSGHDIPLFSFHLHRQVNRKARSSENGIITRFSMVSLLNIFPWVHIDTVKLFMLFFLSLCSDLEYCFEYIALDSI